MSKTKKFFIIFTAVSVLVAYGLYYYVYTNLSWKVSGLDLTDKEEGENTEGINLGGDSFLERVNVTVNITNNSGLPFNLSRFKLKIVNPSNTQIGDINMIRKIKVPANSLQIVNVSVNNVNELGLLSDTLSGKLKDYSFVVSGYLGGFLPFRYKGKLM